MLVGYCKVPSFTQITLIFANAPLSDPGCYLENRNARGPHIPLVSY